MYCRNCGAQNDENATHCARCGVVIQENVATEPIPNYLVHAILVTVFCCLPFGIVSIVYAAQVNAKQAGGDYAGAIDASSKAKNWALVGFLCGVLPMLLYAVLIATGAMIDPNMGLGR